VIARREKKTAEQGNGKAPFKIPFRPARQIQGAERELICR